VSLCSAVSSVPVMNSMSAAPQAAAIRAQPSTESWSVSAMAAKPSRWPCPAQFLRRKRAVGKNVCADGGRRISFDDSRRTHQLTAHLVENAVDEFAAVLRGKFLAMSTASLMLTMAGCPPGNSIS